MLYEYPEEFIVSIIYTDIFTADKRENNPMIEKKKAVDEKDESNDYASYINLFEESDDEYAKKETRKKK